MRDFPSCFGENGVQIADSSSSSSSSNSSKNAQNTVTCVYQCCVRDKICLITITWSKNLMGQGLSIGIDDSANHCLCKLDIKPWLFSKRKGSKLLEAYSCKIDIYWDLSSAKFGSGPEPLEGFYVCVVVDKQIILFLGDLRKEGLRKTNSTLSLSHPLFVGKKENVFGKKVYVTKAQFCDNGKMHDLVIDCDTANVNDSCLAIRVDGKTLFQVKRLRWKFRGNHNIRVDGMSVEILWDVHNWLFGNSIGNGNGNGNAVFMFRTHLLDDKLLATTQSGLDSSETSWSISQRFVDSASSKGLGFSLVLYAWKNE